VSSEKCDDPLLQRGIITFESNTFRMTVRGFLPWNQTYVAYFGPFYVAHVEFVLRTCDTLILKREVISPTILDPPT
jgi:hypothetical protein